MVVNLDQLDNSIADDKTGWLQSVVAKEEREGRMAKKIPTPPSLSSPEIAGNDGVARVQEDPGGGDDQQEIMLSLRMDKPLMVMVMV